MLSFFAMLNSTSPWKKDTWAYMIFSSGVMATGRTALLILRVAGLGELLTHVPASLHFEAAVAHDLEPAVALGGVPDRVEVAVVAGRVDAADRGVEDPLPVGRVVVLVRGVAGLERPQPLAHRDACAAGQGLVHHAVLDDLSRGGVRHDQTPAVGRDSHVVGAVAVHLDLRDDAVGVARLSRCRRLGDVDPHDVAQARARDREVLPIEGDEGVVDVLVVALTHRLLDGEVERRAGGVALRRGHHVLQLLVLVGDDVDRRQHLVRPGVDDRRGAVPVVADDHHAPLAGLLLRDLGVPGHLRPACPRRSRALPARFRRGRPWRSARDLGRADFSVCAQLPPMKMNPRLMNQAPGI